MSKKSKGTGGERELIHSFWATNEWVAHRIAGSGSSKYPSPDIIASNNIRKLAIECKTCSEKAVYIKKKEMEELIKFGSMFGAESWIGVKFSKTNWLFLNPEDLKETQSSYSLKREVAISKGLLFEELIN